MSSPLNPDALSTCIPTFPYRNSRTKNELRDYMPELPIDAACLRRVAISNPGVADFIASGSPFPATPPAWATALGVTELTLPRAGMNIQVNGDVASNLSQVNDIVETAVKVGEQAIEDVFWSAWCAVTPPPNAGPSLFTYGALNPSGPVDYANAPLTLDRLALLLRNQSWRTKSSRLVFVMHSRIFAGLESSARAAQTPLEILPLGPDGQYVPTFLNIPIAQLDHISLTETTGPDTSSVYLLRLGDGDVADGIRGVFVGVPRGRSGLQRGPIEPRAGVADVVQLSVWREATLASFSADSVVVGRRSLVV